MQIEHKEGKQYFTRIEDSQRHEKYEGDVAGESFVLRCLGREL